MAPAPFAIGLEFFLDTVGIDAAQIRTGLVFETSRLGLSDVPADRRRCRSPSSDDNNVRHAENTPRRLCDRPPQPSRDWPLTGRSGRSASLQNLTDPCRKPTHDAVQSCNLSGQDSSSSSAFAFFRSAVSNPSVNQAYIGASNSLKRMRGAGCRSGRRIWGRREAALLHEH